MYLVTGTRSGLGKFLQDALKAVGLARGDSLYNTRKEMQSPFEAIIHCAFNVKQDVTSNNLQEYINDNLVLAQQLLTIPHKKFIFISSADVYPKADKIWKEEDEFPIKQIENLYGFSKLMVEGMIKAQQENYLILRPTALLGVHARPNSLIKMLDNQSSSLTLNEKSCFNYILHQDVLQFIQHALLNNLCGTYNLAASDSILLKDVAKLFNCNITFGSYLYQVAQLCNKKAVEICNIFLVHR